jgi:hypothetical protein
MGLKITKDGDLGFVFSKKGGESGDKDFYVIIPCDASVKSDPVLVETFYEAIIDDILASLDDSNGSAFRSEFFRKRYGKDDKNASQNNNGGADDKMAKEGDDDFPF